MCAWHFVWWLSFHDCPIDACLYLFNNRVAFAAPPFQLYHGLRILCHFARHSALEVVVYPMKNTSSCTYLFDMLGMSMSFYYELQAKSANLMSLV